MVTRSHDPARRSRWWRAIRIRVLILVAGAVAFAVVAASAMRGQTVKEFLSRRK